MYRYMYIEKRKNYTFIPTSLFRDSSVIFRGCMYVCMFNSINIEKYGQRFNLQLTYKNNLHVLVMFLKNYRSQIFTFWKRFLKK